MIDPKIYWNHEKAKVAVAEPELNLRLLSVAVSKELLLGGCILYRIEWTGHTAKKHTLRQGLGRDRDTHR